jgi:hypothetical protein
MVVITTPFSRTWGSRRITQKHDLLLVRSAYRHPRSAAIHPSAWRNCLDNPNELRSGVLGVDTTGREVPLSPLCAIKNTQSRPSSYFPKSFGRGVLRTSPVGGSPKLACRMFSEVQFTCGRGCAPTTTPLSENRTQPSATQVACKSSKGPLGI